ncbi:MAG: hypothetical protein IPL46_22635 [Saprospiraceae bacterium]|nr:hypothetical protein [Saprospiraceae bacterium]
MWSIFLNAVNQTFSVDVIKCKDIVSSWAGLRPLIYEDGKSASEISRKDEIFEADNGLLSIAGGKLTGYRKMAERIIDMVIERIYPEKYSDHPARTEDIALKEDPLEDFADCQQYTRGIEELCSELGLSAYYAKYLVHNYGKDSSSICAGMSRYSSSAAEGALILSELDFCVQEELVVKPLDYLMRRSGRLFFMPESIELVENLIFRYFAERMGFEQETLDQERLRWQEVVQSIKSFNE